MARACYKAGVVVVNSKVVGSAPGIDLVYFGGKRLGRL
jgi:hypothetical protein